MSSFSPAAEHFWSEFCRETGATGRPFDASAFGDGVALQDELAALILAGTKQATCTLLRWFSPPCADRPPGPGDRSIVLDGCHWPCAVIETTSVRIAPVASVDAQFAWDEGEGDRSLSYWLREHRRYFKAEARREGFSFSEDDPAVFERFRLLWKPAIAIRPATARDIAAMHALRMKVRENRLSDPARVTEASYRPYVDGHDAWVAEGDAGLAGFAVLAAGTGSVWALFVDPEAEGRGAGSALHQRLLHAACARGLSRLSLTTAGGTRAERFYINAGWQRRGFTKDGELRLERAIR